MQKRATPIVIALLAVLAYASRDAFLIPFLDAIESHDTEIAGCIRLEEGEQTLGGVTDSRELSYTAPAREPLRGTIGKNSSLYVELRKLGVSVFDIDMMTRETRKAFDWRRVRAGQSFDVYASAAGDLDSLLLYTSPQDYVRVRRDLALDRFVAKVEPVPYEITYQVTHGTIVNSIFASLAEQGAETSLASSLDDIFGWTIDFVSDLRAGDQYVLLYEQRTYETGHTVVGDVLAARVVNQGKEFNAVRFRPSGGPVGYYNIDGSSMQKAMRRAPLKFTHVTSSFSRRRFHPVQRVYKPHYGVDYGAPPGTPVYATGDGLVVAAHYQSGNGNYVKIRHARGYETYYLHLSGFAKGIRGGTRVTEGQLIGFVGATGLATGPHLCYRMMKNGSWVNPRAIKLPAKDPITVKDIARFNAMRDAYMASIYDALLDGLDNRTRIVQTPVRPTVQLRAAVF
jgi:murein DD-endopeptidase MepM/ murein hydrolase activator NlpD